MGWLAEMLLGNTNDVCVKRGAIRVMVTRAVPFANSEGVHDESETETERLKEYGASGAQAHD